MPTKPKTPCSWGRCPETTTERYCPTHREKKWSGEQDRPSASERGYDARWQKVRQMYARKNPLCERCKRLGEVKAVELVHHLTPLPQGSRLGLHNLRSLCEACHRVIHSNIEDDRRRVVVVAGPPGSGKTTYVKQRRNPGDLVVDTDAIRAAIGFVDPHSELDDLLDPVLRVREYLLRYISEDWSGTAWVITAEPTPEKREQLREQVAADRVKILDTSLDKCRERIVQDDGGRDLERSLTLLQEWAEQRG